MSKSEKIKQPTFEKKVPGKEFMDPYCITETGKYGCRTNREKLQ